jgi:ABC-type branched-subunit amino acid transport system ATPase component
MLLIDEPLEGLAPVIIDALPGSTGRSVGASWP